MSMCQMIQVQDIFIQAITRVRWIKGYQIWVAIKEKFMSKI